jgi:myo-inositol-1(or 4)-monophosphatase
MRKETQVAIRVAERAIKIADSREGAEEVTSKGGIDLLTNTDLMCEDMIRAELTEAFPECSIVGEERGGTPSDDKPYWLVDPICGTRPYASDISLYCTNIALVENGVVTIAVIALGKSGEILYAEKGSGATLRVVDEERRIEVGDSSNSIWIGGRGEHLGNVIRNAMLLKHWYIWQFPSTVGYPYVADGRFSGLVHFADYMSSVHTAAGCFLAEEAGAIVTGTDGQPWNLEKRDYILASTPELHKELFDLIELSR